MTKPVPRSRLNISYRTKIDGKPKKAKLPMRLLALGDFTGDRRTLLNERRVHSILPGMKLDSFMQELRVTAPIDEPSLRERLTGALTGEITGKLINAPGKNDGTGKLKVSGKGTVSGDLLDNGLGSFVGEVEIRGEIELPLERNVPKLDGPIKVELSLFGKVEPPPGAEIGLTGDVNGVVELALEADTSDERAAGIDLHGKVEARGVPVELTIPLRSINDFKPLHLAASVPEIRRLVLVHRLVLEARNFISSFPELREVVKSELAKTKAELEGPAGTGQETPLGKLREELRALYPQLVLDTSPRKAATTEAEAAE